MHTLHMKTRFVSLPLLLIFIASIASSQVSAKFVIAQSMHYKGDIDLAQFGVRHNPIIYEASLLLAKENDALLSESKLSKLLSTIEPGPFPTVIDIEKWSLYVNDTAKRADNLQRLIAVIEGLRKVRPDMHFGYYGVIPERVYWPLVDSKMHNKKLEWSRLNDMAQGDFASHVDALFPSLYTFYEDSEGWKIYAEDLLQAARKFKKPVYCYLWPQYHSSNKKLGGTYISTEYWRLELETCFQYSDGIVIWNNEPDKAWDPNAPWWKETVAFIAAHNLQ